MLPRYSPTGLYGDRQLDRTRGFRLLAHAEIESYIEDACLAFAERVCAAWNSDRTGRSSIAALLASLEEARAQNGKVGNADGLTPLSPTSTPVNNLNVEKALNLYRVVVIDRNHGIKQKNLMQMTARIGFLATEFDPVWLTHMDSFGTARGVVAHTSGRTQTPPDPRTESETVAAVVSGLRILDRLLQADR